MEALVGAHFKIRKLRRESPCGSISGCQFCKALEARLCREGRAHISTVRDRVCMTAAMLVLEPIFEADFPSRKISTWLNVPR
jgi:hypothetical protein